LQTFLNAGVKLEQTLEILTILAASTITNYAATVLFEILILGYESLTG
jgi:hypothetical protein